MSPRTGPRTPDDVVTHLREAAHAIPDVRFDTPAVLATAQRALRRRRRRQTVAGAVTAGLLALTVASPVRLPGVGTLTMPGGHQVRTVLGLEDPAAPAPARPGFDLSELLGLFTSEPPSPETMAEEVASLQTHVLPVLKDIQPTWYEQAPCDILEYPRGTFSDNGTCGGRPAEQPFDALARANLNRILAAVEQSGVPTNELMNARYAPDGTVKSAGFLRSGGGIEWNFAYLYSPDEQPREWQSALGPVTITPIGDTGWWFEKSPND
ncbi:hypothetical protein Aple_024620 [Acrocarpospora pleiomorpha]|uniref:Uncharacterized protein n=1 Tax=Acrocarpospora pleiomorpha TaxID=90975 RepID=A0A5M3XFZ5_9ACTN|nr:hypothetical protein [Acrocarpospora pleiomorpha]GES19566.1 hypothetical protein Aple_024620 [Acrocarpospora pleiomorpha]